MSPPLLRSELLADRSLRGRAFCSAFGGVVEAWLVELFDEVCLLNGLADDGPPKGVALVAIGGQGRGELCPQSDLDLLLLYDKSVSPEVVANGLWYPIWDTGLKLGHSVRTVRDSLSLAGDDLHTATALLSARHLAGDRQLTSDLAERARINWRRKGRAWLDELGQSVEERHRSAGEVAFALEPDLKEGRGGLRDVHALIWAREAGADIDPRLLADLERVHDTLLEVRVELHRAAARPGDRLLLQEQDAVAAALGDASADALMARVATAGRTIAWASDESWFEIGRVLGVGRGRRRRDRSVEGGLTFRDGRVALSGSGPVVDPVTVLRVASTAARHEARIDLGTLERLRSAPALTAPWPDEARTLFCDLLLTGPAAIPVIEALDQFDLWVPILPEWEPNRCRPQRNAFHRFTVDRHLLEAAAQAAALRHRVQRPDLLVLAALLHDIGKGYPGDHSEVGESLARTVTARMGFGVDDVATVCFAVRHHLLLPDVATRRDLDDPGTVSMVARLVGTPELLALMHALAEADATATGPAAWGPWRAQLVARLSSLVARSLEGIGADDAAAISAPFPTEDQRALLEQGQLHVAASDDTLTVVCRDRAGVVYRVAGVLALHGLEVVGANIHSADAMVLDEFIVNLETAQFVPWDRVLIDVTRVLEGRFALQSRLDERLGSDRQRRRPGVHQFVPLVRFDNDGSDAATILEVVGPDSPGLLYRITKAIAEMDLDVRSARIATVGDDVVDTFYVLGADGAKVVDVEVQHEVRRALLFALDDDA
jgi:[protein-PII] uridylyltransferase